MSTNSQELVHLKRMPKDKVAKLALSARNKLRKNVSHLGETGQSVTHAVTAWGGAAGMGALNGKKRKANIAAGKDEMDGMQVSGVDREVVWGGLLTVGGIALPLIFKKSKAAGTVGSVATGFGIGIGAMGIGNMVEDRVASS